MRISFLVALMFFIYTNISAQKKQYALDIPVDYFSGSPTITIPLYVVKLPEIDLPITLSYSNKSVKPDNLYNWVGLGWDIHCGGSITREFNGDPDEFASVKDYANGDGQFVDGGRFPDEFSFSFMGYTGYFYLDHSFPARATVISDHKMKVELITNHLSQGDIAKYLNVNLNLSDGYQRPMIAGFVLTTPDGMKYTFGRQTTGPYEWARPTEFTQDAIYENGKNRPFNVNKWYLSKIESNTNIIELNYVHHLQEKTRLNMNRFSYDFDSGNLSSLTWHKSHDDPVTAASYGNLSGNKVWKPILESIYVQDGSNEGHKYEIVTFNSSSNNYEASEMLCLNSISINEPNGAEKTIAFTAPQPDNGDYRRYLESVNVDNEEYHFSYNDKELGKGRGDKQDHWGYYNATSIIGETDFRPLRSANKGVLTNGLLKVITYPSGGTIELEWEANDYMKEGNSSKTYTGGTRIKSMEIKDADEEILNTKNYYYVDDYTLINNSQESSGVLFNDPQYSISQTDNSYQVDMYINAEDPSQSWNSIADIPAGTSWQKYTFSNVGKKGDALNEDASCASTLKLTYPRIKYYKGTHVGYTKVFEVNIEGAYTEYEYTNLNTNNLPSYVDLNKEIGLLRLMKSYNNNGSLVMERSYNYIDRDDMPPVNYKFLKSAQKLNILKNDGVPRFAQYQFAGYKKRGDYKRSVSLSGTSYRSEDGNYASSSRFNHINKRKQHAVSEFISRDRFDASVRDCEYTIYPEDIVELFDIYPDYIDNMIASNNVDKPVIKLQIMFDEDYQEVDTLHFVIKGGMLITYDNNQVAKPISMSVLETPIISCFDIEVGISDENYFAGEYDGLFRQAFENEFTDIINGEYVLNTDLFKFKQSSEYDTYGRIFLEHTKGQAFTYKIYGGMAQSPCIQIISPEDLNISYENVINAIFLTGLYSNTNINDDTYINALNTSIETFINNDQVQIYTFAFDAAGNKVTQMDANGVITRFSYNEDNRLEYVADENFNVIQLYDYSY